MTIYYVAFASAIILSIMRYSKIRIAIPSFHKRNSKHIIENKDIYLFLIFCFVAIIIGLRSKRVGIDTRSYINDFKNIYTYGLGERTEKTEIVNAILMWICGKISPEPQLYLCVHAAIICYMFARFIRENSEDPYLSTIVFLGMFFVSSMNLMRQWLALSFGITSFSLYHKKENKKAVVFLLLAVFTHTTAIVFLIVPLTERAENKKRILMIVSLVSILILLFRSSFFSIVSYFSPKYNDYFYKSIFMNEGAFNVKNLIFLLILLSISYVLIFKKQLIISDESINSFYTYEILMILALAFSFCGTTYYMFHRVVYYFSVFLIVIFPVLINRFFTKRIIRVLVVCSMFVLLYKNEISDNNGISNYMWFWQ